VRIPGGRGVLPILGYTRRLGLEVVIFLKWYYDQKITFIFSSDFKTMFAKHSQSEILALILRRPFIPTAIFRFNGPPLFHQKGYNDIIHSRAVECSV